MPYSIASGIIASMVVDQALKVRENRLRLAATRQGLTLAKSSRRDRRSLTFGTYMLTKHGEPVFADTTTGHLFGKSLDEIEAFLDRPEGAATN